MKCGWWRAIFSQGVATPPFLLLRVMTAEWQHCCRSIATHLLEKCQVWIGHSGHSAKIPTFWWPSPLCRLATPSPPNFFAIYYSVFTCILLENVNCALRCIYCFRAARILFARPFSLLIPQRFFLMWGGCIAQWIAVIAHSLPTNHGGDGSG